MGNSFSSIEKIELIRQLFTTPKESMKDLRKAFGKRVVDNYIQFASDKCKLIPYFEKKDLIGSGVYGSAISFCIDEKCDPKIIMKLAYYQEGTDISIDDPTRPENVEWQVLDHLTILFRGLQNTVPFHVPVFYSSFTCYNTDDNPVFKSIMLNMYKALEDSPEIQDQFTHVSYRINILEYATEGSLSGYIYSHYSKLSVSKRYRLLKSIIFQMLMILSILNTTWPSFRHNDLHMGNILLTKQDTPLEYHFNDNHYKIDQPEVRVLLNDFDFATSEEFPNIKFKKFFPAFINELPDQYNDMYKFFNILLLLEEQNMGLEIWSFVRQLVPSWMSGKEVKWDAFEHLKVKGETYQDFIIMNYSIKESNKHMKLLYSETSFSPPPTYALLNYPLFKEYKIV